MFAGIPDQQERLMAVISRKPQTPEIHPENRTDSNRVRGCQSPVWIDAEVRDGTLHLGAAGDAAMVRGLVFFVCDYYNERSTAEVLADASDPLGGLGFRELLSPTRLNGLDAVRRLIMERCRVEDGRGDQG